MMATQIEQILLSGELKDKTAWLNISSQDEEKRKPPRLVLEVRNAKAKRRENQKLVDELANFGEHELYFRSGGKGTTHLRAARALQSTDTVITSGDEAHREVPLVGPTIADKIDQILKHGRIVHDTIPSSSAGIRAAPIVTDLRENLAVRSANQPIVDALLDYGDSHLHSGHRGRGITHLGAAKAIRDAGVVVMLGEQAVEAIKQVGAQVDAKIDHFLKNGHIDSDQDDDDEQGEEGSEFGVREPLDTPPIVYEVRSKPAQLEGNQGLVDALSAHGEMQLAKWHTGRGTAFMRAARRLCDAFELVISGSVAKAFGCIGDKVVSFIDTMVMFKPPKQAKSRDAGVPPWFALVLHFSGILKKLSSQRTR
ncbi:hypothetical protein PHYPSEUDO_010048 [Phytophthora pseudosyringae]|uniref:Crossover junction endonuclease MUS81-like HHH domain-containing protein n=1 Tax=Phytophthora pseudosyringae TaxID=221518 RepID=A0A8T1W8P4_9STRA|nr:hypothetical protein PHYPSEUDO_010048 [Phytophthora pseudosyringae]